MIKLQVLSVLRCTYSGKEIASPYPFRQNEEPIQLWEEITFGMSTVVDNETTRLYSGTVKIITRDPDILGQFKVNDIVSLILDEFMATLSPSHRTATHPGEILQKEFLNTRSLKELSDSSGIPPEQLQRIIDKREVITRKTAEQLACSLNTTVEFWIGLQNAYTLSRRVKGENP